MYDITKEIFQCGHETAAVLTTSAGKSEIKVIYFDNYKTAEMLGLPYESANASCDCKDTDVSSVIQDNTITINSITYYVESVQPLVEGFTRLILKLNPVRT